MAASLAWTPEASLRKDVMIKRPQIAASLIPCRDTTPAAHEHAKEWCSSGFNLATLKGKFDSPTGREKLSICCGIF